MLKGQDLVVLAALMGGEASHEPYSGLGRRTCLSASEAYASVKRLLAATLLGGDRRVCKRNALEFLIHGLRYAAPVAEGAFASTGMKPVWRSPDGEVFGQAFEPLYETVPLAATKDRALYDRLAVLDMLRGGRLRERQFAESKLEEMLS